MTGSSTDSKAGGPPGSKGTPSPTNPRVMCDADRERVAGRNTSATRRRRMLPDRRLRPHPGERFPQRPLTRGKEQPPHTGHIVSLSVEPDSTALVLTVAPAKKGAQRVFLPSRVWGSMGADAQFTQEPGELSLAQPLPSLLTIRRNGRRLWSSNAQLVVARSIVLPWAHFRTPPVQDV